MEWLILLLLALPFVALFKVASWLDRIEKLENGAPLPWGVRAPRVRAARGLWWVVLLLGVPYFIYADAKVIARLSKYGDCPCDAEFPKKQIFCLVTWDFLSEIRNTPRRRFTAEQRALIERLRSQLDSGALVDEELARLVAKAMEKEAADIRDFNRPDAYPPFVPLCANVP